MATSYRIDLVYRSLYSENVCVEADSLSAFADTPWWGGLLREPSLLLGEDLMPTERALTTKILRELRRQGGWWLKVAGGPTQTTGIPDIIGCYKGRFVALEVKLPSSIRVSKRQGLMLSRVSDAGGVSKVIASTLEATRVLAEIDAITD